MPVLSEMVAWLERFAPPRSAAEWDNVGLLLGDRSAPADRVMTCLTLTEDVADEAIAERAHLIVSHHPILFRGMKRITADTAEGRVLLKLARAGVAVYSPHTAFDNCPGGINDGLARRLGLTNVRPLRTAQVSDPSAFKVIVFLPESDLDRVSAAAFAAGAGQIGAYDSCSFRTPGTGTFRGDETTNPTVGRKGVLEQAPELRWETIVPSHRLASVLTAIKAAHSYEEPAIDVYPLRATAQVGSGEGRIGDLEPPMTLAALADAVRKSLRAGFLQIVGDASQTIRRLAVACGAAGEFLSDAMRERADAFLTGELRFHDALMARAAGIAVLIPGHYATERPGVEDLAALLGQAFPACSVWPSKTERDPLASYN
jgi:dinuclear metal center YbgI/SA1388 family protein